MATKNGNGNNNTINGTNNDDSIYGKGGQDLLYGNGGDDYIDGGIGDDTIYGGTGNDTLYGNNGSDLMIGGDGADHFDGGNGIDTVDYSTSTSAVYVYLPSNTGSGGASGDTFENVENLIGSSYADYLQAGSGGLAQGRAGNDVLYGSATYGSFVDGGRLKGDTGFDTLYMQYGNTEAWLQNGAGSDTISGFDEAADMFFIKLSDFGLGNTLDADEVTTNTTGNANVAHAQFIFESDSQNLWFDSNGTAAGGKILIAHLENANLDDNNLGYDDFNFVV